MLSFIEPNTGGENVLVLEYEILVQNKLGAFETPTSCISSATIISNTACTVTLADIVSQFNLVQGDPIIVKIRARNEIGWTSYSPESAGDVLIVTLPHAPTDGPLRDAYVFGESLTEIKMRLPEITGLSTGGMTILSYSLQSSTDQTTWTALCGVLADY